MYSPYFKGGIKLVNKISEDDLLKCISKYTPFSPTIKIDGETAYIFWLIQVPDEAVSQSIEDALNNLQINDVNACHNKKCELVAFIVHL